MRAAPRRLYNFTSVNARPSLFSTESYKHSRDALFFASGLGWIASGFWVISRFSRLSCFLKKSTARSAEIEARESSTTSAAEDRETGKSKIGRLGNTEKSPSPSRHGRNEARVRQALACVSPLFPARLENWLIVQLIDVSLCSCAGRTISRRERTCAASFSFSATCL